MSVKNYYPEYPEVPYYKSSVEMGAVVSYLKGLKVDKAVKVAVYVIFRNESGNGKSGVNNNYAGIQADNARWPDYLNKHIKGTVVKKENLTGKERRFLAFDNFSASIDFLVDRVLDRGLYVGATCRKIVKMDIRDVNDFAIAYWRSWVTGSAFAQIPANEKADILSMYKQGVNVFYTI
jgi:hypothetical protein